MTALKPNGKRWMMFKQAQFQPGCACVWDALESSPVWSAKPIAGCKC